MSSHLAKIKKFEAMNPQTKKEGWHWWEVSVAPGALTKLVGDGKVEIVARHARGGHQYRYKAEANTRV